MSDFKLPVAGLTLWEPYASLIAVGAKRIETRSWPAPKWAIGQPIAIHAAKRWDEDRAFDVLRCGKVLQSAGFKPWHDWCCRNWTFEQTVGCVVCVAVLSRCERAPVAPDGLEAEFGTFGAGRYAWHLGPITPLAKPVPWVGRQGLWKTGEKLNAAIVAARMPERTSNVEPLAPNT